MNSISEMWRKAMEMPETRWIIAIFGLATCVAIAVYVGKLFRDMALGQLGGDSTSHLEDFHQMRMEGKLNQEEFSKLKEALPEHLGDDLKKAGVSNEELALLRSKKTIVETEAKPPVADPDEMPEFVEAEQESKQDQTEEPR